MVGYTVHPLAPVGAATDMSNEEAPFGTEQASVVGELITT